MLLAAVLIQGAYPDVFVLFRTRRCVSRGDKAAWRAALEDDIATRSRTFNAMENTLLGVESPLLYQSESNLIIFERRTAKERAETQR